MPIYKISFEQLRQNPQITEMLRELEKAFLKTGIDFYLVGAVARDLWMSGIYRINSRRATRDIDFAVLVNEKGEYESLKTYLITHSGFQPTKDNNYVLIWKDKTQVDLLPFGAIEEEDGAVIIEGRGLTTINMPGFKEIYEAGLPEIRIGDDHVFKFCTLPGIVLLKLLAWDDRPEIRRNDIQDISEILRYFFDMYDENIYEQHFELFENPDSTPAHIAARVMGREMKKIAVSNKRLFDRVAWIFRTQTLEMHKSSMAVLMTEFLQNTVEDNFLILQQIQTGFTE